MKQGEENLELVKEESNKMKNYIFQKNRKTIIGAIIIIVFLLIALAAIAISGFEF